MDRTCRIHSAQGDDKVYLISHGGHAAASFFSEIVRAKWRETWGWCSPHVNHIPRQN